MTFFTAPPLNKITQAKPPKKKEMYLVRSKKLLFLNLLYLFRTKSNLIFRAILLISAFNRNVHLGRLFKKERSLGERGGQPNAVSIIKSDVMVLSNNEVLLRSEGGGSRKRVKTFLKNFYILKG